MYKEGLKGQLQLSGVDNYYQTLQRVGRMRVREIAKWVGLVASLSLVLSCTTRGVNITSSGFMGRVLIIRTKDAQPRDSNRNQWFKLREV